MKTSFWLGLLFVGFILVLPSKSIAQNTHFSEISLAIDTSVFTSGKNKILFKNDQYLKVDIDSKAEQCYIRLHPFIYDPLEQIRLLPSTAFEQSDSLVFVGKYYLTHLKFNDLSKFQTVSLVFEISHPDKKTTYQEIKLFPNIEPHFSFKVGDDDLFIGEIKQIPIFSNEQDFIRLGYDWVSTPRYDWRIIPQDSKLNLQIIPKDAGKIDINVVATANRLFYNKRGELTDKIEPIKATLNVKNTRLAFLAPDRPDVTLEFEEKKGIEVQIENNRNLQLRKTYRIEDQSEAGGAFIGEIYTRSVLNNDKVLCWLRPYALHKFSEGYLYLKDDDEAKFITNFAISPKLQISKVSILREGEDWSTSLQANPGEKVELRIEGNGLNKGIFSINEVTELTEDSARSSENILIFSFRIPINVGVKKLSIYNNKTATGFEVLIREFVKPHSLDFVSVSYNENYIPITSIIQPVLFPKTIKDLTVRFNPDLIDAQGKLYGKQYLSITVNLYNNKRELLESRTIDNIVICPGDNSQRTRFYDARDCNKNDIRINDYISRKTYDLADWSRIEITVKHKESNYSTPGFTHRFELILQKFSSFDIEVSFPGGLLVQKVGDTKFGNFGGISLALLAQFSFYHPDKIEKLRPYKIGAGILAFNAFNFASSNDNRDLGLVVIGSVLPIQTKSKLKFPLHAGFGYFLQASRWFYLIGPGIQISF